MPSFETQLQFCYGREAEVERTIATVGHKGNIERILYQYSNLTTHAQHGWRQGNVHPCTESAGGTADQLDLLSTSFSDVHTSRNHSFFGLRTFMNCGVV